MREALDGAGMDPASVAPCRAVGEDRGFRAKLLWMAYSAPQCELELGLFQPHSNALVALDACPVQDAATESSIVRIRTALRRHGVDARWLRAVLLRSNGDEVQAVLVARKEASGPDLERLAADLVELEGIVGVAVNWTPSEGNVRLGLETQHLAGSRRLRHAFEGFAMEVSPESFFQTHLGGAAALVEVVRALAPPRVDRVVDLYSGAGLFAMALADRAGEVLAVERDGASSRDGAHNLEGLQHASARMEASEK